jgi:DNA-binding transcriptional regulator GbsR (MarR family)
MNPRKDEMETTSMVNTFAETFIFHCNNQPFELKAGEKRIFPIYIAKLGAKHLTDKILYSKGIRRTMDDTETRRSVLAEILPELAMEAGVTPMSRERFQNAVEEELKKQKASMEEMASTITGLKKESDKAKELEETLKKQAEEIEALKKALMDKPKKVAPAKKD